MAPRVRSQRACVLPSFMCGLLIGREGGTPREGGRGRDRQRETARDCDRELEMDRYADTQTVCACLYLQSYFAE